MDAGSEATTDPVELARVRRQARAVHMKSLLVAVAVTAIVFVI